jgi:hypothetical protein
MYLRQGEIERGLDHFGDAHVRDHVVGLTGRYCQRGIRADERLSYAAINLDVESGDRDARVGSMKILLSVIT